MVMRLISMALVALPASAVQAGETLSDSRSEICADDAGWAADRPEEKAREFGQAFRGFDRRLTALVERLAAAFHADGQMPNASEMTALRAGMEDVYRALARLLPLREAGNEAWPMKFLLEQIPGGVPLPDLEPPDREEVLRAAFLRELVTVSTPGPGRSKVRFLSRLELARSLLGLEGENGGSDNEMGALRLLANGALTEAYVVDFRDPALHVLEEGWHTSLASRLRWQVVRMCREAES